jgi:heterodisulfide reductase subunit B
MQEEKFLTKARFTKLVERVVKEHKSSYMDAIIHACDNIDLDLEDVRKYIAPAIKDKLEAEAMHLNYLPRGNTLPVD